MTNRTASQIQSIADLSISLYYDIAPDDIDTFIDDAGMDANLPRRDALANAIAFDMSELIDNDSESDDMPYFTADDIDAIADAIADKLLAR